MRSPIYVGIDVGKRTLAVGAPGRLRLNVANDRKGLAEMLRAAKKLKKHVHFVYEASGYGRTLRSFLFAQRCKASAVDAWRVRQFAKASGEKAKTDPIDADILAQYAAKFPPIPDGKPDRAAELLRRVARRRNNLVRLLAREKGTVPTFWNREMQSNARRFIRLIEGQIEEADGHLTRLINKTPLVATLVNKFGEVRGVGALSAALIVAEIPELGRMNRRQVASLAGLAPFARDSGDSNAKRRIARGRKNVQPALFSATNTAVIHGNPFLRPFYLRLRAQGKPRMVAMVATMRKLVIHLNTIAREARLETNDPRPPTVPPVKIATRFRLAKGLRQSTRGN